MNCIIWFVECHRRKWRTSCRRSPFVFLSYIHVVAFLEADGCLFAMTGVYDGVVGQGKEFLSYGRYELHVVGVGEIGATYTLAKKGIPEGTPHK